MKQLKPHHTLTDWDWSDTAQRSLDTNIYVSEPSSLSCESTAGAWQTVLFLCKYEGTLCIPNGRLITYLRHHHPNLPFQYILFRNQHPLGETGFANTYLVYFQKDMVEFTRYVDGGAVWSQNTPFTKAVEAWERFRLTWFSGTNGDGAPALVIVLEKELAGEWIQIPPTIYDLADGWKDSELNRIGGMATTWIGHPDWWDDTEIWKKA